MKTLYLFLLTFFLLLSTSCKNEINVQVPGIVPQEGQVGGEIILPEGNKLDTIGLEVLSALNATIPVNSTYAVDTAGKTSTTLLMNKAGDVVLMGYNYPGQTDSDLSAESTALAILMNTLTLRSLSLSGKIEVIAKIKSSPEFSSLSAEISKSLLSGKPVTDTTNTALIGAVAKLFKASTNLRVAATQDLTKPIKIEVVNTELLLQNNNVAHTYVAGIYKDDEHITDLTINGRVLFATNLIEAAQGIFGDGYGIPAPVIYTMKENGDYAVRIRSGKPFDGEETSESVLARKENVNKFFINLFLEFMPKGIGCSTISFKSLLEFVNGLLDKKEGILNSARSPEVFAAVAFEITGEVFASTEEILKGCADIKKGQLKYLGGVGKLFALLDIAGKFMVGANVIAHTNDLFRAKSAIDTCFQVIGLKTLKCGEKPTYLVQVLSGDGQIAAPGKPLEKPLVVKVTYEDGKPAVKTTVNWAVILGGGKLDPAKSVTSYDGIAQMSWTLGSGEGQQQLEAFVNRKEESRKAVFSAESYFSNPHKIEIAGGNNQYGEPGASLPGALTVKVVDRNGKAMEGAKVTWNVKSGGGELIFNESITNSAGIADNWWKLGASGIQEVEAIAKKEDGSYLDGAPLSFAASSYRYYFRFKINGIAYNLGDPSSYIVKHRNYYDANYPDAFTTYVLNGPIGYVEELNLFLKVYLDRSKFTGPGTYVFSKTSGYVQGNIHTPYIDNFSNAGSISIEEATDLEWKGTFKFTTNNSKYVVTDGEFRLPLRFGR